MGGATILDFNKFPVIHNLTDSHIIGAFYVVKNYTTAQRVITWGELLRTLSNPYKTEKANSPIMIPSLSNRKTKEAIYEYERNQGAAMSCLWVDIDDGSPALSKLISLTESLDITALIYSSASSNRVKNGSMTGNRWRIMIPITKPITTDVWKLKQKALASFYGGGMEAARITQPIYLPCNADGGYYETTVVTGNTYNPDYDPDKISGIISSIRIAEEESARLSLEKAKTAPIAMRGGNLDDSVIERVRRNYNISYILESYGYERDGRRYIHPSSQSGTAGVVILDSGGIQYYYSHHASDPLADGHRHDVFDLIVQHEFNGDVKEAVKRYSDKVFTETEKQNQRNEWINQQKENEKQLMCQIQKKESLFISAEELLSNPVQIDYLIKKAIEYGTTNVLFGASGGGKSFVAVDMACSIVTGRPWNGNKISRRGAVLILAGEGRGGMLRRLSAWIKHNNVSATDLHGLYISRHTLLMDGSNIDDICAEMNGIDTVLIIVDTLNRHLDGDENTTKDMSVFIRHVDTLRDKMKSTAMIVHHPGKADPTVSRGNSALKAALDCEILCHKGVLEWTKTKDMEKPNNVEFKLHQIEIGIDEDGEKVTSCVPHYGERPEQHDDLTTMERVAIDALVRASATIGIHHNGYWGALSDDWKMEFIHVRTSKKTFGIDEEDTSKAAIDKSFTRCKSALIKKGVVESVGNIIIPKRTDHQDDIQTFMCMPFAMNNR